MDEHNPALLMTPAYTLVQRVMFAFFGSSFFSIRLLGALSLVGTISLVAARLRVKRSWALSASILIAVNPILFAYSRVAFIEPFQLFLLGACWFFATSNIRRPRNPFLSGLFAGIAVMAKPTAAPIALLCLVSPWINPLDFSWRFRVRRMAVAAIGGIASLVPFVFFLAPHSRLLAEELSRESSLIGLGNGFSGVAMPFLIGLTQDGSELQPLPGYWLAIAPILGLGALRCARRAFPTDLEDSRIDPGTRFTLRVTIVWAILGAFALMLQNPLRTAPRYWLHLLVPAYILLATPESFVFPTVRWSRQVWIWLACTLLSLVIRGQYLAVIYALFPGKSFLLTASLLLFAVGLGGGLLVLISSQLVSPERAFSTFLTRANGIGVPTVIVVGATICTMVLSSLSFTMRDASRRIAAELPDDAVLTGRVANTMVLETRIFAYDTRDLDAMGMGQGILNDDPLSLGTTHIVSTTEVEGDSRGHDFPLVASFDQAFRAGVVPDRRYASGYRYVIEIAKLVSASGADRQQQHTILGITSD